MTLASPTGWNMHNNALLKTGTLGVLFLATAKHAGRVSKCPAQSVDG